MAFIQADENRYKITIEKTSNAPLLLLEWFEQFGQRSFDIQTTRRNKFTELFEITIHHIHRLEFETLVEYIKKN